MLRNINLQTRLISAFVMMGLIVLMVALIGWNGTNQLSRHIETFSNNSFPSAIGLWKINEGQHQIRAIENQLLNPQLTNEERENLLTRNQQIWKTINQGLEEYQATPRIEEEDRQYQQFLQDWDAWKNIYQNFMDTEEEFSQLGIRNPWQQQLQLVRQPATNRGQQEQAEAALTLLSRLNEITRLEEPLFTAAKNSILEILDINVNIATSTQTEAIADMNRTQTWVILGMILGPLTAIILGIFLSWQIAKPLDQAITGIINVIVTSATEIAATVEQQERITTEQAASVNQTTTTMDELGASSQRAVEQADDAVVSARQVAQQIIQLSDQTRQISTINSLVGELANQTNMLALNASVEAVRAGEHGQGFAVVAAEIRKLADESKKSAQRIGVLVGDIQRLTGSYRNADSQGNRIENIVTAVNKIVTTSQQISLTAKQQAVAINQVVTAMNTLNAGAQQTASGITQTKVGIQKLNEAAQNLKTLGLGSSRVRKERNNAA
jgi:hypothetical protein